MRNPIILAAAAIALPLAACEQGAPEPDDTDIVVPEGDYAQRIAGMEEGARNATFLRAIRDAGRDCQTVQSSSSRGQVNDAPAWTATCDNGSQWTIILGRDGTATVVNAQGLETLAEGAQPQ